MKRIRFVARALRVAAVTLAAGMMLAGCASLAAQNSGGCTGQPSYCNVFFGG
ncbi:MAG TPA: hypothetical protein VGL08_10170 [Paraburkholderia sp.]|jgi:hypothetical protein